MSVRPLNAAERGTRIISAGREVAARELVAVERAAPLQQDQQVVPPHGVEPFRFAGFELFVDEAAPDVGPVVVAGLVFAYI